MLSVGWGNQVVDLQFGMGEGAHHILLELYAQGNLLLTDADYNVLTLLRTHRCNFWELNYIGRALTFIPIVFCKWFPLLSVINCRLLGN